MTRVLAGTSGFSYKAWKGPFYPDDLPAAKMLSYYAGQLPTVEINNTFYRMPKAETLEKWSASVPAQFRFSLKASRRLTHQKRLQDCADSIGYLIETSKALGAQRGPFLLQLPPYLRCDLDRLSGFLGDWPADVPAAFEFRHASWFQDDVYALLRDAGMALCIAESGDVERDTPVVATADWGYLRLRRADYTAAALTAWAERIQAQGWREAYVFFKHEDEGAGPRMAGEFNALVTEL